MSWWMEPMPQSESEWLSREEDIERFEERRRIELEDEWKYGSDRYVEENVVEAVEFARPKGPGVARLQMELGLEEVA